MTSRAGQSERPNALWRGPGRQASAAPRRTADRRSDRPRVRGTCHRSGANLRPRPCRRLRPRGSTCRCQPRLKRRRPGVGPNGRPRGPPEVGRLPTSDRQRPALRSPPRDHYRPAAVGQADITAGSMARRSLCRARHRSVRAAPSDRPRRCADLRPAESRCRQKECSPVRGLESAKSASTIACASSCLTAATSAESPISCETRDERFRSTTWLWRPRLMARLLATRRSHARGLSGERPARTSWSSRVKASWEISWAAS